MDYPLNEQECNTCIGLNTSEVSENFTLTNEVSGYNRYRCVFESNESIITEGFSCIYKPNVFLTSILLFLGTFSITMFLKNFRASNFFGAKFRSFLSDFAVIIGKTYKSSARWRSYLIDYSSTFFINFGPVLIHFCPFCHFLDSFLVLYCSFVTFVHFCPF